MANKSKLDDILNFADKDKLFDFIKSYAQKDVTFNNAFLETFSPNRKSKSKQEQPREDYVKLIQNAFVGQSSRRSGRYDYYNVYDDFGFDADAVSEQLEALLEKARYYIKYENIDEAILIAKKMIETIPDEWDQNFDYEGDVQVMYDEAIDILEGLFKDELLSEEQKELLFDWYEQEAKNEKHEHIALNTSLDVLEDYFLSGVKNGLERTLQIIDQQIASYSNYKQEGLVRKKIEILHDFNQLEEANKVITDFLHFPRIRKIRLKEVLDNNDYQSAIKLIDDGIEIAKKEGYHGSVISWKEELLTIYQLLGEKEKELKLAKELFTKSHDSRKYYKMLKRITPKSDWQDMLEWILKSLDNGSYFGVNDVKAEILVEHKMWDKLWSLCQKGSISDIERYEKFLRPQFDDEIFKIYHVYVEKQATITDKDAYKKVSDTLIRMKTFTGGKEIVKQLVAKYRLEYKRRPNMMKELNRV